MESPAPPEIVLVSHYNLDRVREILAEDPSQLNVMYEPWGETPLGAASHVGHRAIAEYLLSQGAPLVITTAAMLARKDDVVRFLGDNPSLANSAGAHGISLLYHAALGGDTAIADLIVSAGGRTDSAGHALHAAVAKGHAGMTAWLLSHHPDVNEKNFQGKTALAVALEAGQEQIASMLRAAGAVETA